jgi:putative membrane protein
MNELLAFISTSCIVVSAILMAIGWYFIRHGKKDVHMRVMLTAAFFALAFFIIYMSRTIFVGNTSFGGPEDVEIYYTIFLIFHIVLATTGGIFGIVTLVLAFRKSFFRHRKIAPWTAIIWFCTAVTGITVYLLLYVFFPHGETTSMIKAILGG